MIPTGPLSSALAMSDVLTDSLGGGDAIGELEPFDVSRVSSKVVVAVTTTTTSSASPPRIHLERLLLF